jgi:hypothetical protein
MGLKKGGPNRAARENHAFFKALKYGVITSTGHRAGFGNPPGIYRSIVIQHTAGGVNLKVSGRSGGNDVGIDSRSRNFNTNLGQGIRSGGAGNDCLTPVGVILLAIGSFHRVNLLQDSLGFRLLGFGGRSHKSRDGQSGQNTDDNDNNHQLDKGETLLAIVELGKHTKPPKGFIGFSIS